MCSPYYNRHWIFIRIEEKIVLEWRSNSRCFPRWRCWVDARVRWVSGWSERQRCWPLHNIGGSEGGDTLLYVDFSSIFDNWQSRCISRGYYSALCMPFTWWVHILSLGKILIVMVAYYLSCDGKSMSNWTDGYLIFYHFQKADLRYSIGLSSSGCRSMDSVHLSPQSSDICHLLFRCCRSFKESWR